MIAANGEDIHSLKIRTEFFKMDQPCRSLLEVAANQSNLPVLQEPFPGRRLKSILSHWSSLAINWSPPGHTFIPQRTWFASCGSAINYKIRLQWEIESNFSINCWKQIRNCFGFASIHLTLCDRPRKLLHRMEKSSAKQLITRVNHPTLIASCHLILCILIGCCHSFGFRFSKTDR